MKCYGYYRLIDHKFQDTKSIDNLNNIEDLNDTILVNCSGGIHMDIDFTTNVIRNDFYLLYLIDGGMTVYINNKESKISRGMGIVYYPGTPVKYSFKNEAPVVTYYWVHFTGSDAIKYLERFDLKNNEIFDIGIHNELIKAFDSISLEILERKEDFAFSAGIKTIDLLLKINRYKKMARNHFKYNRLSKSTEYMQLNYMKDITIEELSEMENLSPSRYRALFKELNNVSPKTYLTNIRINNACNLLSQTKKSINDIGKIVGYDNQMYFCRVFSQKTNTNPSNYRKMHKEFS